MSSHVLFLSLGLLIPAKNSLQAMRNPVHTPTMKYGLAACWILSEEARESLWD